MTNDGFNSFSAQKEHAIVHFFAVLAGVDDIRVLSQLMVSGIGGFVGMDAVVLGIVRNGTSAWMQQWRAGSTGHIEEFSGDEAQLEAVVSRALAELEFPFTKVLRIVHQSQVLGYIGLARRDAGPLSAQTEFLISSLQTLTALLLANHRAVVEIKDQSTRLQAALESLNRRNRTLDGINTIFKEALNCETDEQLGQVCLKVAEEITGSKFGFIGEIGTDGLLHDLAISDPGWKLCAMQDQTGHRREPGNFKIHGVYGRVLQDERSLLTNTPANHPDAIGTPPGHPALTAFVGVPLIDAGRTAGMIAMANREGGYGQEEVDALEALAPAIVEALRHRRIEQALIRSEKLASVGRIAATIAHEMNNPLSGAINALYLVAQDSSLSEQGRTWATTAEQELRRAAQIARRILGFYREPNARTSVPLIQVLEELKAIYAPRLEERGIHIRVSCRAEEACALGNSGELRQLISNLLVNSIDAVRDAGTVYLRVGKISTATGVPKVCITVADTGVGIEPGDRKKIFEPFFTTKHHVGTGLGLWIVAEIVKKHGGSIRLRSRVGKGTVFRTLLPAYTSKARAAAASNP